MDLRLTPTLRNESPQAIVFRKVLIALAKLDEGKNVKFPFFLGDGGQTKAMVRTAIDSARKMIARKDGRKFAIVTMPTEFVVKRRKLPPRD